MTPAAHQTNKLYLFSFKIVRNWVGTWASFPNDHTFRCLYVPPKLYILNYSNNICRSWHFQTTWSIWIIPQPELNKDITFPRRGGLGWQTPNLSNDISQQHNFRSSYCPITFTTIEVNSKYQNRRSNMSFSSRVSPEHLCIFYYNISQPYFPK